MYCNLCGAEIPDGAETCPECGVDLRSDQGGDGQPASGAGADATSGQSGEDRSASGEEGVGQPPSGGGRTEPEAGEAATRTDESKAQATGGQPAGTTAGSRQGGGQPSQEQPHGSARGQPQRGQAQGQQAANQPRHGGQPPGAGQPTGGAPPGGHQGAQPGAGQPGGGGRGGGPAQGRPGGYGGGFDLGALADRLPLLPAAVGGAVVGVLVFGVGIVVGAMIPSIGDFSALDLGAAVTMDLHFGTPEHVTPALYSDFQVASPPNALLGVLYLLPPLLLYQVSKLSVDFGWEGPVTRQDAALSGASVALGYLPIMFVGALLVPEMGEEFSLVTALLLSGVVYPLVFGAIGGLSAGEFTPGQRRVGTLYGVVGFLAVLVGLFVSSYVFINTDMVELATLDRLFATIAVLAQTHGLSFGTVGENLNTLIPILLTVLVVGAIGFLRVWRSYDVRSPVEAAVRAMTPAVAYTFLFGILASASLLFADPFVQEKLEIGFLVGMFAEALAQGPLENIGAYVTLVFKTLVVFPVVIGGAGGALAWWVENRNRRQY